MSNVIMTLAKNLRSLGKHSSAKSIPASKNVTTVELRGQAHTPCTHVCGDIHSLFLEHDSPLRPGNIAYIYI